MEKVMEAIARLSYSDMIRLATDMKDAYDACEIEDMCDAREWADLIYRAAKDYADPAGE